MFANLTEIFVITKEKKKRKEIEILLIGSKVPK